MILHYLRPSIWIKTCAILVSLSFALPYLTWAFEANNYLIGRTILPQVSFFGKKLTIPEKFGTMANSFQGNEKTIVCIQDLHCNYEVQKNISNIIHNLVQEHGLNLAAVEGAFGRVNTAKISTFPVKKIKAEVCDYFVKQGKLTGAEYYAVTSKQPIHLEGIETPELYVASEQAVRKFLNAESQGYCYDLREIMEELKANIYNSRLLKFDNKRVAFREGELDILRYSAYLQRTARGLQVDLSVYPNLVRFLSLKQNFFSAQVDSDQLFQELDKLDASIRQQLYSSDRQRKLDELYTRLDIIERLLNISVSQEELQAFRAQREKYTIREFIDFINQAAEGSHARPTEEIILDPEMYVLDDYLNKVEEFYLLADERSIHFVDNLVRKMDQLDEKLAVMISGGFHADKVLEELEKRNISYVSLKPRLTRQDVVNPYFSLLQDRKTPLEKLLAKNQTILAIRLKLQDPLFLMQMELLLKPVVRVLKLTSAERRQLRDYLAENDSVEVMAISKEQAGQIGILDIKDARVFKTSFQVDGKNTMVLITPDKMWAKRLGRQILAIDTKTIACCGKTINIYSSLPDVIEAVRAISTDQPTAVDLAQKYGRRVQGILRDLANVFITKAASRIFAQYNRMIRAMPTGITVALYIIALALILHLWPGASADIISQPWLAVLCSQILLWGVIKLRPTWQQAIELRPAPNIFNMAGNGKSSLSGRSAEQKRMGKLKHSAKEFDKTLVQFGSDLIFVKLMERGAKAIQFNITEGMQPNIKEAFRDIQQGLLNWKVLNNEMVVWPKPKNMSAREYIKGLGEARADLADELFSLMEENKAYMIELAADTDQTMLLNRDEAILGVAEGRLLCEINEKKAVLQAVGISDQQYYQNIDEARQKAAEEFEALLEAEGRIIDIDLTAKEIAEIENFEKTGHPNTDEMIQAIRQGWMRFIVREDGAVLITLTGISAQDYYQHLEETRVKMAKEMDKHVPETQVFIEVESSTENKFSGTQRPNIFEAIVGIETGKLGWKLSADQSKVILYTIDVEPEEYIQEIQQLREAAAKKYAAQIKPGQIYMEKENGQVSEDSKVVWPNVLEAIQHILEGRLIVGEEKGAVKIGVVGDSVNYCGRIKDARDEYVQKFKKALSKQEVVFIEIYNADEETKKAGIWPNIDEAILDIRKGQVIPKITDDKIMLEVVEIKPAEYIKAKIQFRQKSADEFLKLFPKLSQEDIENAIFIGPGSEDKAGAYAAIMFYGLPNYRVESYQAIKEGRMIWNYENKVLKREVVVYIVEFLKQMTAARQEQADELLRYRLKNRQHTITVNTREKKSSEPSKPVKKKKPEKSKKIKSKANKADKKLMQKIQAKNTINIIEAYRNIMQGLAIPCEQPNKQKALKPVDLSRSELLEIVKSKKDESLNQAIPALVAGKEIIEISGRAFTQEELIRGIALEELVLSYDADELQVKLAPVSTDSDKAKIFAPENNMATISEEEMALITKPKAFTPIPHMSLIPERWIRAGLDWLGRKMGREKMPSWVADLYLVFIGPLGETELLRRVISSVSIGVSIWWLALGFAFAHTIIEWLDRAQKNGWKKVFTRQLLLLDLKDFAFRVGLGALYFWPFRWDYPLWAAFGISWLTHSAYNSMALAVNSWLESKDISFRVPLTSLINPPLGVAGKPADIGEEVIREELSPEDDVLEYLDEMEPKPKTPGKRKRFEIIVNTKEQYEDLYDLGFRPDEAARTRQLNDLQHVVEEITYNDVSVEKEKTNNLRSKFIVMTFNPPREIDGTTYSSLHLQIRDKSLLKGRKTLPLNPKAIITALCKNQLRVAKWTGPVVFCTISEEEAAQYPWLVTAEEWKVLQKSKQLKKQQTEQSKKQKKQKQKTPLNLKPPSGVDETETARAREEKFTAEYKKTISEELEYLKTHPNAVKIMQGEEYSYFHSEILQIIKKIKISIKANPDKQLKNIVLWSKKPRGNTDYGNIIKKYYKTLDKIVQERKPLKQKKLITFLNLLETVHKDDFEYLENITSCYELANKYKIIDLKDGKKFNMGFNQVVLHVAIIISALKRLQAKACEYLSELEGYEEQALDTSEEDFQVKIITLDKEINAMVLHQSMSGLQESLRALSAYYAEHGDEYPSLAKTVGKEYERLADEQGKLAEKIEEDTVCVKDLDSFFDRLSALTSIDFHALWAQVKKRNKEEYNLLLQGIVSAAKPVFVELGWVGFDIYKYFDLKEIEPSESIEPSQTSGGLMPWLKELLVERWGLMSAETYDNWAWLIEAGPMFAAIMIATYTGFLDPAQGASALILVGIQYSWGAFFLGHIIPKAEGRQALHQGQFHEVYKSFTPQDWKNVKIAFGLAVVNILFSFALPLSGVIAFGLVSHYFVNLITVLPPFDSVSLGEFLNVIGPNETLLRHPVGKIIYARIYGEDKDLRKAIFGPNFTGWRKDIIVESGLGFAFKRKIVNAAAEKDKTRELLPGDVKFIITVPAWAGKAVKKSLESENIIWRTIARYIAWRINQQFNKYAVKIRRAKAEDLAEIAEIYGPGGMWKQAGKLYELAKHGLSMERAFYSKQSETGQVGVFGPQILEVLNIIASTINEKAGSLWNNVNMNEQLNERLGQGWENKDIKWAMHVIQNLSSEQIAEIENPELRLSLQSMQEMLLETKKQPELKKGVVRSIQKQLMRLKNGAGSTALKLELLNITETDLPKKHDMAHLLFADKSKVPAIYQQIVKSLLAQVGENQRMEDVLNFIQGILSKKDGILTAVESAQLKHILAQIAPAQPIFTDLGQGFLPYQVNAMVHNDRVEEESIITFFGKKVKVAIPAISHVLIKSDAPVTADKLNPDTLVAVVPCHELLPDINPITPDTQRRFKQEVVSLTRHTIFTRQFGEMEAPLQHYNDYCLAKSDRKRGAAEAKFARSLMSILKHQAQQPGTDIKHYEAALLDLGKYFENSKMFGRETAVLGTYTSAANKPYKIYIPKALRMGAIHQNALLYSYKKITGSFEMEPNLAARINERRTLRFSFANAA